MTQQTRIWATGPSGEVLPVVCDAQGNLVIQLEGATVNVGDVDVLSSVLPTGAATSANQTTEISKLDSIKAISDLIDLGGAQRLPGNGASQALTVPANTLIMRVDAEGGAVRISHTGAASATTIPRVPEEAIDYIPLKSTDTPQFYGASASVIANINYYGART